MLSDQLVPIPENYICPITQEMMVNPVMTADGFSYEKSAILKWIQTGRMESPLTGLKLDHDVLTPNHSLRAIV